MTSTAGNTLAWRPTAPRGAFVGQFRDFYTELASVRDRVMGGAAQASAQQTTEVTTALGPILAIDDEQEAETAEEEVPSETPPEALPIQNTLVVEAQQRLQALLEGQALDAGRRGGEYGVLFYRESQYVMAALADEVFVTTKWPGQEAWKQDLLETRLFGTYSAGQQFFQRLDKLLEGNERAHAELGLIYLLALSFGFRGKYRGADADHILDQYRRRLFSFVYRRQPGLLDSGRQLCAETYEHTLGEATGRLLPSPIRWFFIFGVTALIYLVAQHFVWDHLTNDLETLLNRVL